MPKLDPSNAELLEFIQNNVATKEDLKLTATKEGLRRAIAPLATKEELKTLATKTELLRVERDISGKLDGISKQLGDLKTENVANTAAHRRFDHRDRVFAGKLRVDLDKVGAKT